MTTRLRLFLQIQQTLYMSHSSTFVSLGDLRIWRHARLSLGTCEMLCGRRFL